MKCSYPRGGRTRRVGFFREAVPPPDSPRLQAPILVPQLPMRLLARRKRPSASPRLRLADALRRCSGPRLGMLLIGCGLACLCCESTSSGCPRDPVAVPVDFFGDVKGAGEIKVVPGRLGSITLEGTVSRGAGIVVKISGPGACSDGVIGATFHGVTPTQKGIKIEEGKFAAVFEPRPLGGKLVGG